MEEQGSIKKVPKGPYRTFRMAIAAAAVALAGTGIGLAWEESERRKEEASITLSQLPEPARMTLEKNLHGGELHSLYAERKGKGNYEAVIRHAEKDKEIKIAPSGELLETEEEVAMADLPITVRTALKAMGGEVESEKIEKVISKDGTVYFEAVVEKDDKEIEVKVSSDGKPYSGS